MYKAYTIHPDPLTNMCKKRSPPLAEQTRPADQRVRGALILKIAQHLQYRRGCVGVGGSEYGLRSWLLTSVVHKAGLVALSQ